MQIFRADQRIKNEKYVTKQITKNHENRNSWKYYDYVDNNFTSFWIPGDLLITNIKW